MLARLILFSAAIIPAAALGCSCIRPADLSSQQISSLFQHYPIVVRARIVATEQPLRCRLAPVRWLYAAAGATAQVKHTLLVRNVIRGQALTTVSVVQKQGVEFNGCQTSGSAACEPHFLNAEDVWVLRKLTQNALERAPMCTEGLIRKVLGI